MTVDQELNTDTADPPASAPVALHAVSKRFGRGRGAVTGLDRVSLSFPAGSFTAVLGVSGSGKSTLLQCAAGLDQPTSGTVWLCGQELARLSDKRRARLRRQRVGFVFQDLNLVPELTVGENIALPLRLDRKRVSAGAIERTAARVGLHRGQLRRLPSQLSGGQQQRAAIARALVISPEVIFADEPTASLDPHTAEGVMTTLRQAAAGTTIVVVTHQPEVTRICDRAVFLYRGGVESVVGAPEPAAVAAHLHALGELASLDDVTACNAAKGDR
jgi:putative ABC transport system ATP-binding protein